MRLTSCIATFAAGVLLVFPGLASAKDPIGLVTGPNTGTYIAIGRDIAKVAENANIKVEVKPSDGSIDNIKRITSHENATLGIVQSDVLGFLKRSRNPDTMKIATDLRMVLPLYKEEVHVLARNGITDFKDLQGKKVVVGEEGSGNMLTAVNLLSMMDIKVADTLKLAPPEGVVAVLQNEADAIVIVGGKPLRLFKNLEDLKTPENQKFAGLLKQVHFLPLNDPRMLEEYPVAEIALTDYNFIDKPVPTIAVTAYLVTFDFAGAKTRQGKLRCEEVGELAEAVRANIDNLRETGHPKWKEVDLSADGRIWEKDSCSWPPKSKINSATGKELLGIVGKN